MDNQEKKCSAKVSSEGGKWGYLHKSSCKRPYFVTRDVHENEYNNQSPIVPKYFCKIHDPEYRKAKSDERQAKWDQKMEYQNTKQKIVNQRKVICDWLLESREKEFNEEQLDRMLDTLSELQKELS